MSSTTNAMPRTSSTWGNGDDDKMVPTKNTVDMHRRLPDSELVIYPDAGHGASALAFLAVGSETRGAVA